jgi:hypothetical protein
MTEAVIITNEELAILCDIVGGWSSKLAGNADTDKQHALDRLIANGLSSWLTDLRYKIPTHRQNRATFHPTVRWNKRRLKAHG